MKAEVLALPSAIHSGMMRAAQAGKTGGESQTGAGWAQRAWDNAAKVVDDSQADGCPVIGEAGDDEPSNMEAALSKRKKKKTKGRHGPLDPKFVRILAPLPDMSSPRLHDIIDLASTKPAPHPLYVEEGQIRRLLAENEQTTIGIQVQLPESYPKGNVNIYFRSGRCVIQGSTEGKDIMIKMISTWTKPWPVRGEAARQLGKRQLSYEGIPPPKVRAMAE